MTPTKQAPGTQPPACGKISEIPVNGCISELNCLPICTEGHAAVIRDTQKHLRAYDELLSHRHPAPVADERAELTMPSPIPAEVQIAAALSQAEKALIVLFTMLKKAAPQGAVVADEILGSVKEAQKLFSTLVIERTSAALSAQPSGALERESVRGEGPHKEWEGRTCPLTNRPYFMHLEHPSLGLVPTYGGPFDSYTTPSLDDGDLQQELRMERYDHDRGDWIEGGEPSGLMLVPEAVVAAFSPAPPPERAPGGDALLGPVGHGVFLYNGRLLEVVHTDGDRAYQATLGGRYVVPLYIKPTECESLNAAHPSTPPPSSSPSATADATSSVAIATLRAALEKYGEHHGDCSRWVEDAHDMYASPSYDETQPCTCGFDAALAGNEGEKLP